VGGLQKFLTRRQSTAHIEDPGFALGSDDPAPTYDIVFEHPEAPEETGALPLPELHLAPEVQPEIQPDAPGTSLRRRLVACDALVSLASWIIVLSITGTPLDWRVGPAATALMAATLGLLASQNLFASRVCQLRSVELTLLARVAVILALAGYFADRFFTDSSSPSAWLFGGLTLFAFMAVERGVFSHWLKIKRAGGRHVRPLVIVGSNDECAELVDLILSQPELGYRAVGYVGQPGETQDDVIPWLGAIEGLSTILDHEGIDSVLIAASAVPPAELNQLTRDLLDRGTHVHLSSGLARFAVHRLRPLPLGHEPLFYLEPWRPSRLQLALKRTLDLTVGSVAVVLLSPVMLVAAIAIKLTDGGPVFYRHDRVGRGGPSFTCFKFRSMRETKPDDDARLAELNLRSGPLFKAARDPRVTRVGVFLRASSIDELPQLFNVLNGTMSLVGPRPALPSETQQFDLELQERFQVPPGITGLWQVEARDNPEFSAYRRLDLFYIENWSIGLDITILLRTIPLVAARAMRSSPDAGAGETARTDTALADSLLVEVIE
jgi:exopolysaccharide biosynthesis polyprenyl glycosylphosphotransferase